MIFGEIIEGSLKKEIKGEVSLEIISCWLNLKEVSTVNNLFEPAMSEWVCVPI